MTIQRLPLAFMLFLCAVLPLWATPEGWELLRQNRHVQARQTFEAQLQKDSLDTQALRGLIFLSELEGDHLGLKKYARRLVLHQGDIHDFYLYSGLVSAGDRLKIEKRLLNERDIKAQVATSEAYKHLQNGQYDEARQKFAQVHNNLKWSLTGPFTNIEESGHYLALEPEKGTFSASKEFVDETGLRLKWVACRHQHPDGRLYYDNYLPSSSGGVYYANTFFTLAEDRPVQVRITRKGMVKVWVDDHLVYEKDNYGSDEMDADILQLSPGKGTHRLLVKFSKRGSSYRSYDYDDDDYAGPAIAAKKKGKGSPSLGNTLMTTPRNSYFRMAAPYAASSSSFDIYSYFSYNSSPKATELVRITDTAGNALKGIDTDFEAPYTPKKHTAEVVDNHELSYYVQAIAASPNEMYPYYGLLQQAINSSQTQEVEEMLVRAHRANPETVFFKYLLGMAYGTNGKRERAFEQLNSVNLDSTPVFLVLYNKLAEKDPRYDSDEWVKILSRMDSVSPSNIYVIRKFIEYYEDNGMKEEKKSYGEQKAEQFPEHARAIERLLDDKKSRNTYSGTKGMVSYASLKSEYGGASSQHKLYSDLRKYKRSNKTPKVYSAYDAIIEAEPYNSGIRRNKISYMMEQEEYRLALAEADKAILLNPYIADLYELKADAYAKLELKDSALAFYHEAKRVARHRSSYLDKIDKKVKKIEKQKPIKKLFTTPSFDSILTDKGWKNLYQDEQSVVLMYTRDLAINEFGQAQVFQKMMIKILTREGVTTWTEYHFGFMGELQSMKIIKRNGSEVYPDVRGSYAVLKNLEPGDIIQVEGVYDWQPMTELGNELSLLSNFSFEAPVYFAKMEVAVPQDKYLGYKLYNLKDNLQVDTIGTYKFYRWQYSQLPALEEETAVPDEDDIRKAIMISTMSDWSKVVSWYDRTTLRRTKLTYEVKEALDSIVAPGMTDAQKADAIYSYLTREIKYSFVPFLQSGYVPKRCGLTLSSRIGDCKDVAGLMVTMLREAGVPAWYVLVKTRQMNHMEYLPSQYFNHAIAAYEIDGKMHYADLTTDFFPGTVLPESDAEAFALLIRPGETGIMRLPADQLNPKRTHVSYTTVAQLGNDKSLQAEVKATLTGTAAGYFREEYTRSTANQQHNMLLNMLGRHTLSQPELKDHNIERLKTTDDSLFLTASVASQNFADKLASLVIFRLPLMNSVQPHSSMRAAVRHNRIDVADLTSVRPRTENIELQLPSEYKLLEVPQPVKIESPYGSYSLTFRQSGNKLLAERSIVFNQSIIEPEEYDAFRSFYQQLVEADATRIALIRKGTVLN